MGNNERKITEICPKCNQPYKLIIATGFGQETKKVCSCKPTFCTSSTGWGRK